jgi:phenylacetate-CoA ligase
VTLREPEAGGPAAWKYQSALPDVIWPAIPSGDGATSLGILLQLESTQWLSPDRLLEFQMSQLEPLLRHAFSSVPHYRQAWSGLYDPKAPLTRERFSSLPHLTRRELQENFDALKSERIPPAHGSVAEARSSGSTGSPVRVLKTRVTQLMWNAFTLRDHLWHRRDLRGKLAAIRHGVPTGEFAGWGAATHGVIATGPSVVLGVREDIDAQLRWLQEQRPEYLLTYPSNLAELVRRSQELGVRFAELREARTLGEVLPEEVRQLCRTVWGLPVADMYSAEETGYIALQCPQHEHYHAQSEGAFVEILDEQGRACSPGEIGRVVVTTLHNFATPLVRYELGDYAEAGEACPCGRGLPVLRRIMGRVRNMLVTEQGKRFWPAIGGRSIPDSLPIRQFQLVQKDFDLIEARLVVAAPLSAEQENAFRGVILSRLPPGLKVRLAYSESIPRGANNKFEDFVSEVARP